MKENKTVQLQRKILADNVNRLLKIKGKTQTDMARELKLAETTVSSWLNCERYPRLDKIQLLADYFNVYRSDLTEDKTESGKIEFPTADYPLFNVSISAGLPLEVDAIEEAETITLPDIVMGKWARDREISIMRVNGDSMNNIMPHNSLIAVRSVELPSLSNGDIVVYSNGGDYSVKRFYNDPNSGHVIFRPDSKDRSFFDHVINYDDMDDIKIHGKVVLYIVEME